MSLNTTPKRKLEENTPAVVKKAKVTPLKDDISEGSFSEDFDDIEDSEMDHTVKRMTPEECLRATNKVRAQMASGLKTSAGGASGSTTGPMSIWRTSGEQPTADFASPAFDPKLLNMEKKALPFQLVSDGLTKIEERIGSGKGSGKNKLLILTNIFRTAIYYYPSDLICMLYILIGKVAPDFKKSEIGIGDSTVIKAVAAAFGVKEASIKAKIASGEAQDLGEVALIYRMGQKTMMKPQRLLVGRVFKDLRDKIAYLEGKGSNKQKQETMQRMLAASEGDETKYLTRIFQTKLRTGIQNASLIQAIAFAFTFTSQEESEMRTANMTDEVLEDKLVKMESAVRRAFSEMPDYGVLTEALLAGKNASNLGEVCKVTPGIPVKPMLAKPTKGIGEILERFNNIKYTAEFKYDGERAQIHVVNRTTIHVYSRNSEDMTEKYPDVLEIVKSVVAKSNVKNCIIDSEVVGYDIENDKILPFQVLANRPKKNVNVSELKVQVCLFGFDLIYLDDVCLTKESFRERRTKLRDIFPVIEKRFVFAKNRDLEHSEEDLQEFLNESIDGSCEGLMLKTLDDNATYEPSKRSLNWLKLKKDYLDGMADSLDVVPVGAWYGKGKRSGTYGAFLLAIVDTSSGDLQTVCKAGTGFSDQDLSRHYTALKDKVIAQPIPHLVISEQLKPDVWFDPSEVWEIIAADITLSPVHTAAIGVKEAGRGISLRFPRFIRVRDDKGVEDASTADQLVDFYDKQAVIGGKPSTDD